MTNADLPQLQVQDLHFAYPGRALWAGWSCCWGPGVSLVCGGDGAGKTTLLRLLAGQVPAPSGQITLRLKGDEAPLAASGAAYRARVAWIDPRQPGLPSQDGLTAAQWLATLPARYPRWDADALQAHVQGWALDVHLSKPFHALSTGTQRKLFMAAVLASGAPLTLIDEPVGGLDKPSIAYLQQALDGLAEDTGRTVIVAHYEVLPGVRWHHVTELDG